jgi:hypothetical protein
MLHTLSQYTKAGCEKEEYVSLQDKRRAKEAQYPEKDMRVDGMKSSMNL